MQGFDRGLRPIATVLLLCVVNAVICPVAHAWGDEGHEIVGLIAEHYLSAPVKARVTALLAGDHSGLTADTSIASESTWADRFRDSDREGSRLHYEQTYRWHFVDIELRDPEVRVACYGYPRLPAGTAASAGPARDCIIDKIQQFAAELAEPQVSEAERRLALQFLLHFVGDLHQPLHAADDRDQGGNRKRVVVIGERPGSLHHYWDSVFVRGLGDDPRQVAAQLIAHVSAAQRTTWRRGGVTDWALESFALARSMAYGQLPAPSRGGRYRLSARYAQQAQGLVALQLSRAGVRLAMLLNRALGAPPRAAGG